MHIREVRLDEAEHIAMRFHENYERLAPSHGYDTRPESAVPWFDVPLNNRELMISTVIHTFMFEDNRLVIRPEGSLSIF